MESVHNPDMFMASLRQILSQGRKRIGFLVGAGGPLSIKINKDGELDPGGDFLIPGVDALTTDSVATLTGPHSAAVNAIISGITGEPNIEKVLSKVRLLEAALEDTKVHGLDGRDYGELAKEICKAIGKLVSVNLPKGGSGYTDMVSWVNGTIRQHPVEIFTTNYDLLFEEAFERSHAPYFDGFSGGSEPFFDPVAVAGDELPPRWSKLWKLHGSLGWTLSGSTVVRTGGRNADQMVYPDHLKYGLTQKQPYSALFERLKQFLLSPDSVLLASGFSFRDAHIGALIEEALAMNANAAVLAFQYGDLAHEEPAAEIAKKRPNFSTYCADGAIVGGVQGGWRPGDLPKNWENIRSTYWTSTEPNKPGRFILGDFGRLMRFCALSQSTDLARFEPLPEVYIQSSQYSAPEQVETTETVAKNG